MVPLWSCCWFLIPVQIFCYTLSILTLISRLDRNVRNVDRIPPSKLRKSRKKKVELSKSEGSVTDRLHLFFQTSVWDSRLHPTFPSDWRLILLLIGCETAEIRAAGFYYYLHISLCRRQTRQNGREKKKTSCCGKNHWLRDSGVDTQMQKDWIELYWSQIEKLHCCGSQSITNSRKLFKYHVSIIFHRGQTKWPEVHRSQKGAELQRQRSW